MSPRALLLALPALAPSPFAAPPPAQDVFVVDDVAGPGVDFTSLTAAVAAAADGDVVLIKSGLFEENVLVDGKGIALIADAGANVEIRGRVEFSGLAAGQTGMLADVTHRPPSGGEFGALDIAACDGPVLIQRVTFTAEPFHLIPRMVQVQASTAIFTDCTISGGTNPFAPGAAMRLVDAETFLYGCDVQGLHGAFGRRVR